MTAIQDLREEVKHYIDNADEMSLRRVKAILEVDREGNEDTGEDLPEELQNAIDEAIKEGEEGNVISHEQFKEMYGQWLRK